MLFQRDSYKRVYNLPCLHTYLLSLAILFKPKPHQMHRLWNPPTNSKLLRWTKKFVQVHWGTSIAWAYTCCLTTLLPSRWLHLLTFTYQPICFAFEVWWLAIGQIYYISVDIYKYISSFLSNSYNLIKNTTKCHLVLGVLDIAYRRWLIKSIRTLLDLSWNTRL